MTVFAALLFCSLRPASMEILPLGSVCPADWLEDQLEKQSSGLTGHAEGIYADIGASDWLTGEARGGEFAWERGPYYAKGLVALAFTLDDAMLKAKARRWVEAILASQRENGDFGPKDCNWWANMIALSLLRDWAEATGDARVEPFLAHYFAFQREAFATFPLARESKWAVARAGDELEIVLWLFERKHEAWLLEFARTVAAQSADWTTYYMRGGDPAGPNENGCRSHIVNFMQGLKTPALKWRLGGEERDALAYRAAFDPNGWVMRGNGRPDGMANGSEPLSGRSASEGTELCAIAERIASCQVQLSVFADARTGDDLESVAYNALAGTLSDDGRGIRYYSVLNLPACVNAPILAANNAEDNGATCPGPHSGFGCCRSNFHMAWPKFVQTMWMARGGGLAAILYGPCRVQTAVATIAEGGSYPFGPDVRFCIEATSGDEWPMFLRIPGWCASPSVRVNGTEFIKAAPGTFVCIRRVWRAGDVVELELPMEIRLSMWENNAVAVSRGPLLYALKTDCEKIAVTRYRIPFENRFADMRDFPRWEYVPRSGWGYALVIDGAGLLADAEVRGKGVKTELRARARKTDYGGWGYMRDVACGRAVDPPPSPLPDEGGEEVRVTLVPFGLTQTRIALFPWVAEGQENKGRRAENHEY